MAMRSLWRRGRFPCDVFYPFFILFDSFLFKYSPNFPEIFKFFRVRYIPFSLFSNLSSIMSSVLNHETRTSAVLEILRWLSENGVYLLICWSRDIRWFVIIIIIGTFWLGLTNAVLQVSWSVVVPKLLLYS